MDLRDRNVIICFFISFSITLFFSSLCSISFLHFFPVFLVILFYKKSFHFCLWAALGCGLILDLLGSSKKFGMVGIDYLLTTALLYRQRRLFFPYHATTLPFFVFLFTFLLTLIHWPLCYLLEKPFSLRLDWLAIDLLFLPLLDSTISFLLFVFPFLLLGKRERKGKEYFLEGEES